MGRVATFDLPAPPSVNHYWRKWRGRVSISNKGRLYRQAVVAAVKPLGVCLSGEIGVSIIYGGKCDLDNILKCLLDALEHAEVYADDKQIADLRVTRGDGEGAIVEVREL